jgi:hypothetical protein
MGKYILLIVVFFSSITYAQNNKQNVRGIVLDKASQAKMFGAKVQLIFGTEIKTVSTDENGKFIFSNVSPERYVIKVNFIGYQEIILPNVIVTSGKEVILDIALEDEFKTLADVVVKASNRSNTINKLSTVSARTFSMEEVNRYAGGRSDPARLAANFAGVTTSDDSRNDIIIRGNSPNGILWRIDGMNVTNPNHFASVGTTGGAVSALNTNLLKSSDFFTSAFPAEYGNATSGVFDLGFRSGNTTKRETTLQMGVITGLEATTEGPINKEKNSSYLVGYRYSLAGLAQNVGIDIGTTGTPVYQDLSFKVDGGTSKIGKFSTFGILATSEIDIDGRTGSIYGNGEQTDFKSSIGIFGLNHFKQINPKSYMSTTVGLNYTQSDISLYETNRTTNTSSVSEENNVTKTGYNFMTSFNSKINSRLFVKVGLQEELMGVNLFYRTKKNTMNGDWLKVYDNDDYTSLIQTYAHAKYNLSKKITLNTGLHSQYLTLNNSLALEPRLGLKYDLSYNSSFSFGYGLHAQMQPTNMYFAQTYASDGSYEYTNKDLGFTKSNHFVLAYDLKPSNFWRLKSEVYYQKINNVPVNTFSSTYSSLNSGSTYKTDTEDSLTNNGSGRNYGVELTLEKFFSDGYYGLATGSLYAAKYTASDGVERNSAFNGTFVYNILAGKEWKVGVNKKNKFNADIKITNAGGRYYTPIDLASSIATGQEQRSTDAYSATYSNYFRMDFKVGYSINSPTKKLSQSFSLDIQNITNRDNVFSESYDNRSQGIKYTYQLGLFPNVVYKIQF